MALTSAYRDEDVTSGPAALVAAVIQLAVWDAKQGKPEQQVEAWRYFTGGAYREHLSWLGAERFRLPQELLRWN
ncbi:MAG: hypothetical protein KDE59_30740 [Anaerolineales bacterium]|nr:hypothetical protein [Anaerolineales bacterium]MCB0009230.1 hypothetical protein [Anaerolineales bacterium]